MLEKRFPVVPPQAFTANGTANGVITIPDTTLFKVKQDVFIAGAALPTLDKLEVKNVLSRTQMVIGPDGGAMNLTTDLSLYTTAANSVVFCPAEQKRPAINQDEYERAVYEEEPIVAKRVILVDDLGNKYTQANPLPVDATVSVVVPPVTVDLDAMTPPNRPDPDNVLIVGSEDGTKGGLKRAVKIDANGNTNVINMGGLVPKVFDDIKLTYSTVAGQQVVTVAEYRVGGGSGTLVATLTLSYDVNANLTEVART